MRDNIKFLLGPSLLVMLLSITACVSDDDDDGGGSGSAPTETHATSSKQATEPAPTGTAEVGASAAVIRLSPPSCCGAYNEVGGESYLFVLTFGKGGQADRAMLRSFHIEDDGQTGEEIGSLEAPLKLPPTRFAVVRQIAIVDGVLYVPLPGEDEHGLWVVDGSDPASMREIAFIETDTPPLSVTASGDRAVVATMSFSGPFLFFDISDPGSIELASKLEHTTVIMPPFIELVDSLLYIGDTSGVSIFDVSAQGKPKQMGAYENPNWKGPSAVEAPPDTSGGVYTPNSEDLAHLGGFSDFAVSGGFLYIGTTGNGLQIIDVSDPASPQQVSHLELDGNARLVEASADQVSLVLGQSGEKQAIRFAIQIIDSSDPNSPQVTKTMDVAGMMLPPQSLLVTNDALFLLGDNAVYVMSAR